MWNGKKVSVVFPAYNEEENIVQAVDDFHATGLVDEIIVVDNNSKDRTAELVRQNGKARLVLETTQGYGAALRRGLREATGDFVILSEPDGTFLGRDVIKLLSYTDDFDMVLGTRTTKELIWEQANMGWAIRVGNWAVAKMMEFLFDTPGLTDCGCTMRLVKRAALERFRERLTVNASHFLPEMVILAHRAGVSFIEIPVNYKDRRGVSKITGRFGGLVKTALNMIRIILRYRILGR
ncbi:MAG: glycosyltransferase family 2 protein [Planctomycetes bacterium]|nr:glycosyltransferase family 2 protein [Planctomycetota bacterium]